jgi:uncharacterized protein
VSGGGRRRSTGGSERGRWRPLPPGEGRGEGWRGLRVVLAVGLLLLVASAQAQDVPYLAGRINDLADLIPADQQDRIEAKLAQLEAATGAQVAVLTVESLQGEDPEGYALRVAETWKLGRAGVDDGALLLVSRDDRRLRLEVGYGLEPKLTDALSRSILDDVIVARFRAGDFGGGIEAGVEAIAAAVEGRQVVVERPPSATSSADGMSEAPLLARLGFFAFFLFVVGIFSLSALFTDGCGGWFLYAFLIPFWSAFPLAIWGLPVGAFFPVAWVIGFPIAWLLLNKTRRGRTFRQTSKWGKALASSGGWRSSGGRWSAGRGWSSSGRSSSGGFSGGGGRFGGGGASSRW